jgi:hypothetical protein
VIISTIHHNNPEHNEDKDECYQSPFFTSYETILSLILFGAVLKKEFFVVPFTATSELSTKSIISKKI